MENDKIKKYSYNPEILWWYDLDAPSLGSAAVGDIDGDNNLEIVFGTYFNDEHVYALNAENGTLLWKYNTGGCNDASPAIADVDLDGELEVIIPSSSPYTVYCFDGSSGTVEWSISTGYPNCIDSPPAIADVDNDNKPEVILGSWYGYVFCLNGEDGSICWQTNVGSDSYIQSGPNILDLDDDDQLDVVVAQYAGDCNIYALKGDDGSILWYSEVPQDYMYHGGSFADIDEDDKPEIAIGSYDNHVYVFNGEDGSHLWNYTAPFYIGAPTSIADLNNDEHFEIIFASHNIVGVLSHTGSLLWNYYAGGSIFRGTSIADTNGDGFLDVVFGSDDGILRVLRGDNGSLVWSYNLEAHYGNTFHIDHAPVIADFDNDGELDIFLIGGYATSSSPENNYGRAYVLTAGGGNGSGWMMFRHDLMHSGCFEEINQPPAADFTFEPSNPAAYQTVYFNSTSFSPAGFIANWSWDFGDGNISYGENVTHQYANNGSYFANHTVTDDNGLNDSIVKNIIVGTFEGIVFYTGWNLVTVPVQSSFTASSLLSYISGSVMVSYFDALNQTYKSYVTGDPPPYDFPIQEGYGYFVYMNQDNAVQFSGDVILSVSIPLYAGYNMIGWYQSYNTSASGLLSAIPGALIASIFDPVNQTYKSFATGDPPPYNFTVTTGMGVFVWTDQTSTWDGTD